MKQPEMPAYVPRPQTEWFVNELAQIAGARVTEREPYYTEYAFYTPDLRAFADSCVWLHLLLEVWEQ